MLKPPTSCHVFGDAPPHGCRAWKKSKFPGCRAGPAWRKWWLRRNAVQFHEPIIGCHPPVNSLMWTWNNNPGPFFDEQAVERDVWVQILKCWYLHSFGGHGFTLPPKNGWRPYMAVLDILGQSQLIGGVPFSKFSAGRGRAPVVGRCWAPTSSLKLEVSKAGHQWTWYILLGRVFPTVIELTRKDADSSKDTQWYSMFLFCLLDPGMLGDIFCNPMCRMSSTKLGWRTFEVFGQLVAKCIWLTNPRKTWPDSNKASGPAPRKMAEVKLSDGSKHYNVSTSKIDSMQIWGIIYIYIYINKYIYIYIHTYHLCIILHHPGNAFPSFLGVRACDWILLEWTWQANATCGGLRT